MFHLWQHLYWQNEYYGDGYYNGEDEAKYECQYCEVDANAFAYLIVDNWFCKYPQKGTWKIYSYDLIMERVEEIKDNFHKVLGLY